MKKTKNNILRVWRSNDKRTSLPVEGDAIKAVEIDVNGVTIRVEAYRHGFSALTVKRKGIPVGAFNFFHGQALESHDGDMLFAWAIAQLKRWKAGVLMVVKEPKIVHHPHYDNGPKDPVKPITVIYLDEYPVYESHIGSHGSYQWRERLWPEAENHPNPNIRRLWEINARVFPRYAKKAHGRYLPGDFICLGGPDAFLFKDDPEAVRFIIEHTALQFIWADAASVVTA